MAVSYHNIEKNWSKPGYHGWDASGRLWQIKKDQRGWVGVYAANPCNIEFFHTATLKIMSECLAATVKKAA